MNVDKNHRKTAFAMCEGLPKINKGSEFYSFKKKNSGDIFILE